MPCLYSLPLSLQHGIEDESCLPSLRRDQWRSEAARDTLINMLRRLITSKIQRRQQAASASEASSWSARRAAEEEAEAVTAG